MKIELFEKFNLSSFNILTEPYYEIYGIDRRDDEYLVNIDEYYEYNPYDLEDVVKLLDDLRKKGGVFFIKKITPEVVDEKVIEQIILGLKSKTYNI
jgi:hypothetical protein